MPKIAKYLTGIALIASVAVGAYGGMTWQEYATRKTAVAYGCGLYDQHTGVWGWVKVVPQIPDGATMELPLTRKPHK